MSRTPTAIPNSDAADVRSVSLISLGCPKNLVDSEKMLGLLAEAGLSVVSDDAGDEADAVVVNTCGFLEASKEESLGVINDALERKRRGEIKRVIVAGCLVQRHRAKILDWAPGVDALIGVFDRDHIVDAVTGARADRDAIASPEHSPAYWIAANALKAAEARGVSTVGLTVQGKDGKGVGYFESDAARLRLTPRHFAYLRVSEGCNQRCAFCTIPSIRGKMRSKPIDRIVREARELLEDGAFELNLIGQDTTSYGDDIGLGLKRPSDRASSDPRDIGGLPALLAVVNDAADQHAAGHAWIRLMYAYPSTFSDEMIDALADLPHVVKYIDMPLQHASDRMLTAMRRNVTRAQTTELIHKLRERIPGMALRTTMITGFPGETEEDHEELLEFIDEIGFDMLGVFKYSREDGTPAGTMDADPALHVPEEIKARRYDQIMRLQQQIAFDQARFIADAFDANDPDNTGHRFDVLIDEAARHARHDADDHTAAPDHTAGAVPSLLDSLAPGERLFRGRAYFQAPQIDSVTYVRSRAPLSPGELVRCTIIDADGYDLIARPTTELSKNVSLPLAR